MPINSLESFVDRGPPTAADRTWFRIVRRVADIRGTQTEQYSLQTSLREASGYREVSLSPASEELELMLADMNTTTRRAIHATLPLLENMGTPDSVTWITPSDDENFYHGEDESGILFSTNQVEAFMQSLSRVEMGTLGTEDLSCSICKEEYGKQRGDSTQPASGSDPRLLDEESPEHPLELPCRHVFGEWCIRTWLLEQPASCPTCRFRFKPVGS